MRTSFKVTRSTNAETGSVQYLSNGKVYNFTAETKSVSYLPKGRLRNFKTGTPIEHVLYQMPRPAIKAYEILGHRLRHTVSAAHGGHAACFLSIVQFCIVSNKKF